ncbi:helix-turn-helix transcriptional regulator [Nocardioides bruguierae]|uniref:helix-turn-helix transcriptional regulator n=1 Tax=Nocardioides bruguierae TaxID=2945102 RepID=UPI002022565A|nr:metalloregulator ArsR/SmtB family transcription factor [Nocardioides bruguierae]MCL8024444.1 transcriptional regulator [Nocardioides bruguierae]
MEFTGTEQKQEQSTRRRVASTLLARGPQTAAALASELGLTPAAVRRHLEALQADGAVEPREPRTVGSRGRGRPAKVFALTEQGREGFASGYDDLAVQALRFLAETGGDDAVRAFAEQRVSFIEDNFEDTMTEHPEATPAEVLALVLSQQGYAASVRDVPAPAATGEQLCQQHCPVSHVAHEFPQLCEAETAAISRVLERHVLRLATIAHGDGVCTTCIPEPPAVPSFPQASQASAHSRPSDERKQVTS